MARKLEDNHSIATPVSVLRTGRSDIKHHPINLLGAELEALEAEYKALWDAVIAYANAPEDNDKDQYVALVRQAIASRFWNEFIDAQNALASWRQPAAGAVGRGEGQKNSLSNALNIQQASHME